jgi:ABC-type hemin transport system substrate-binding protein
MLMDRKILAFFVLSMFVVGCTPEAPTPQPTFAPTATVIKSVNILRLDSNYAEFAWSQEIRRGVIQALSENGYIVGENVVLDERYLDTKRQTSTEYLEKIATETIAYIREMKPDMVIVNDDAATRLVVQPMRDDGIPFVILGLNGKPENTKLKTVPM